MRTYIETDPHNFAPFHHENPLTNVKQLCDLAKFKCYNTDRRTAARRLACKLYESMNFR